MSNTNKPKPHPHAELIKAWADGAKIQKYMHTVEDWKDDNSPQWLKQCQYRIKPEEPTNEPWKPMPGEAYRFITSTGKVVLGANQNKAQDANKIAIGNCFPDSVDGEKQAEAAAERVKAALKGELKIPAPSDENFQLDGKPLTDGEKALIRALRDATIRKVFPKDETVLCFVDTDMNGKHSICDTDLHIAFETTIYDGNDKDEAIIAALKQIQAEQESNND